MPTLVRIHAPFLGSCANRADGPLRIGKGIDFDFVRRPGFARQPVLQNERRHADAVQPLGDIGAFGVDGEKLMSAAGRHDHGRAGCFIFRGQIDEQRRIVNAGDMSGVTGLRGGVTTSGFVAMASEPGAPFAQSGTGSPFCCTKRRRITAGK